MIHVVARVNIYPHPRPNVRYWYFRWGHKFEGQVAPVSDLACRWTTAVPRFFLKPSQSSREKRNLTTFVPLENWCVTLYHIVDLQSQSLSMLHLRAVKAPQITLHKLQYFRSRKIFIVFVSNKSGPALTLIIFYQ